MDDDLTQVLTQRQFDPRRVGRNNSGLSEPDVSDVICILHPSTPAAFRIVHHTAKKNDQHVLKNNDFRAFDIQDDLVSQSERSTLLLESVQEDSPVREESAMDLALRFSSRVNDPSIGFCFGRSALMCDINLDAENSNKRVSNTHFRIFYNHSGVLMLGDMSTNGTIVDSIPLGGKRRNEAGQLIPKHPASTRMLNTGSIIEIVSDKPDDIIKFVLRIPPREGYVEQFKENFRKYIIQKAIAEKRAMAVQRGAAMPDGAVRGVLAAPVTGPPNPKSIPGLHPNLSNDHGMHWSGGDVFKCTGILGKGAFATVYQLATRMNGELFAGKELEKRRFMKNGMLDHRLDNEMQIMKDIKHPNVVQYVDYVETDDHLYIIMEYVRCGDIAGYMQGHGTLPERLAKTMTQQILSALAYLHEKNITHRDIKPDNILISSEEPFVVKLTDFGLSKVVKNNDTFLKTFCGTLLYCAPEVFPHYDNYIASKRAKRRRGGKQHRSYGSSVDIWSYAAVLWFVLCGTPPFEGVVDGNGKGMFQKIMETPLDTTPLIEQGVSDTCIDLLLRMLDTDPLSRPDELTCLKHPWLREGSALDNFNVLEGGLDSIPEGDEELDASQLSIHDRSPILGNNASQDSVEAHDTDHRREPKRHKGDSFLHFSQAPFNDTGDSYGSITVMKDIRESGRLDHRPPATRLFGEVSESALLSSGNLNPDVLAPWNDETYHSSPTTQEAQPPIDEQGVDKRPQGNVSIGVDSAYAPEDFEPPHLPTGSSWRESMVRGLNMESSDGSSDSLAANLATNPGGGNKSNVPQALPGSLEARRPTPSDEDTTPKARQTPFNRQINIPISASFFYVPHDPSTHNIKYATKVSGIDFAKDPSEHSDDPATASLPETVVASLDSKPPTDGQHPANEKENETLNALGLSIPETLPEPVLASSVFAKPPPILGRLSTTPGSFTTITFQLTSRVTTWGRSPGNRVVYRDGYDTRIPKVGLEVWFLAPDIETIEKEGKEDWTGLKNLETVIATRSRAGVRINGVLLNEKDDKGRRCYGRVYSGDEVCVVPVGKSGQQGLTFICEFFFGRAKKLRKQGDKFTIEHLDSFNS